MEGSIIISKEFKSKLEIKKAITENAGKLLKVNNIIHNVNDCKRVVKLSDKRKDFIDCIINKSK